MQEAPGPGSNPGAFSFNFFCVDFYCGNSSDNLFWTHHDLKCMLCMQNHEGPWTTWTELWAILTPLPYVCRHFYLIAVIKCCGHLSNPLPHFSTWFVHGYTPLPLTRVGNLLCESDFRSLLNCIQLTSIFCRVIWRTSITWGQYRYYQ